MALQRSRKTVTALSCMTRCGVTRVKVYRQRLTSMLMCKFSNRLLNSCLRSPSFTLLPPRAERYAVLMMATVLGLSAPVRASLPAAELTVSELSFALPADMPLWLWGEPAIGHRVQLRLQQAQFTPSQQQQLAQMWQQVSAITESGYWPAAQQFAQTQRWPASAALLDRAWQRCEQWWLAKGTMHCRFGAARLPWRDVRSSRPPAGAAQELNQLPDRRYWRQQAAVWLHSGGATSSALKATSAALKAASAGGKATDAAAVAMVPDVQAMALALLLDELFEQIQRWHPSADIRLQYADWLRWQPAAQNAHKVAPPLLYSRVSTPWHQTSAPAPDFSPQAQPQTSDPAATTITKRTIAKATIENTIIENTAGTMTTAEIPALPVIADQGASAWVIDNAWSVLPMFSWTPLNAAQPITASRADKPTALLARYRTDWLLQEAWPLQQPAAPDCAASDPHATLNPQAALNQKVAPSASALYALSQERASVGHGIAQGSSLVNAWLQIKALRAASVKQRSQWQQQWAAPAAFIWLEHVHPSLLTDSDARYNLACNLAFQHTAAHQVPHQISGKTISAKHLSKTAMSEMQRSANASVRHHKPEGHSRAAAFVGWRWWASASTRAESSIATLEVQLQLPVHSSTTSAKRPYVSLWFTDAAGQQPIPLLLQGKDPRWYAALTRWWSQLGAAVPAWVATSQQDPQLGRARMADFHIDQYASATQRSGPQRWHLPLRDRLQQPLAAGDYLLWLEVAREHGGRELLKLPFRWPLPQAVSAQGRHEITAIEIRMGAGMHQKM